MDRSIVEFRINATREELPDIWVEWLTTDHDQRFGQWFYNNYCEGRPWPLLFYETDHSDAYTLVYLRLGNG
jgi:hypothetical protein